MRKREQSKSKVLLQMNMAGISMTEEKPVRNWHYPKNIGNSMSIAQSRELKTTTSDKSKENCHKLKPSENTHTHTPTQDAFYLITDNAVLVRHIG